MYIRGTNIEVYELCKDGISYIVMSEDSGILSTILAIVEVSRFGTLESGREDEFQHFAFP